jgi:hypothetical protein
MDPVKQYRERFKTLCTHLKKFFSINYSCTGYCNQGRNCTCTSKVPDILQIDDMIGRLHYLSSSVEDNQARIDIKILADDLAKIGNRLHEKNPVINDTE